MRGININDFYTGININQMTQYCYANKNTKEWERWTPIPIFPIEATNSLTCFLINHCNKLYYYVFYLVNLLLDYSSISYGFDICPCEKNYYFWQHDVLAVKSHQIDWFILSLL